MLKSRRRRCAGRLAQRASNTPKYMITTLLRAGWLFLFLLVIGSAALGQSSFAPLDNDYYHRISRYETKSGRLMPHLFTGIRPYARSSIAAFADSLSSLGMFDSRVDQFNLQYLRNDNWEWTDSASYESQRPLLRHFYKSKSDFYHVRTSDFDLHVNPVLYVGAGSDSRRDDALFVNTRGVEVRGVIDNKVGFYTYLADNQALLPSWVGDAMTLNAVVPGEGFWKRFKQGPGVDYLHARGYITFPATQSINVQFGHDRMFLGNGNRSLIFSDFAPPFLFLKGNVKVWKLNYATMVGKMTASRQGTVNGVFRGYPEKYVALHHLSVNIGKRLNIGVFESVVFSPQDTTASDRFRIEYLNPIIFYRAIEQQNGSTDNVMLGMDFKWLPASRLSLYGQFVLDEFVIDNIRAGNGWWANKFAVQLGGHYIDAFGLANLDLQGEINVVRPYTYSHYTIFGNYTNFQQAIAHPLGANFNEVIGIARYQPVPRLTLEGKLIVAAVGRDSTNTNWGGDILKSNRTREKEFGNKIGQGTSNDILYGSLTASWMVKHNLFVDASVVVRNSESPSEVYNNRTTAMALALRWNIARRLYEF